MNVEAEVENLETSEEEEDLEIEGADTAMIIEMEDHREVVANMKEETEMTGDMDKGKWQPIIFYSFVRSGSRGRT